MSTFNDTLNDIWATRAPRIPKSQGGNAYFAGVCEGLGARYRIDPTLLRIVFVVLFFAWGGSLVAYLILMLLMPRFGMSKSPWDCINADKATLSDPEKNDRDTGYLLLVVSTILGLGLVGGVGIDLSSASGLLTLAAVSALIYFLHLRTPTPPEGLLAEPEQETPTESPEAATQPDFSSLSPVEGYPHPSVGRTTPPEWDPLGTSPQLWDLPDYRQPEPEPTKKRKGTGWVVGLLAVAAVVVSVTTTAFANNEFNVGDTTVTVTEEAQLDTLGMTNVIGEVTLDLSEMPALNDDHQVLIERGVGTVNIIPPAETHTEITCYSRMGDTHCGDAPIDGDATSSKGIYNPEATGGKLTVEVRHAIGEVWVR